jgi:DNA-binding CsgD family transcriptional regulator
MGQWDDALAELEPSLREVAPTHQLVMRGGLVALIAAHRDDRAAAQEQLDAAGDVTTDPAVWSNAHFYLQAKAALAEQDGSPAAAVAVLAPCLEPGQTETMPSRYLLLPALTRLALAAGDPDTADAAVAAAIQEADREALPIKVAVAEYCRGLADSDRTLVLSAARYYERAGRPREQAAALEDAAVLAAAVGELAAARAGVAAAVALYQGLGAAWDVRRAAARLRAYGVRGTRAGYRARPATGWEALTPTEVKVAYLVAAGRSNPDIAAELFLSRNTVQTHVSHILAKLGARSRAEIVREAIGHPAAPQPASA